MHSKKQNINNPTNKTKNGQKAKIIVPRRGTMDGEKPVSTNSEN